MTRLFFSDEMLRQNLSYCINSSVFCVAPFWFYISMIKDGGIAIMQNDYCTEHFDMTGWFLVISLARNKTHILQILTETGGIHSYIFFQVHVAEGEHSPEQKETGCSDPFRVEAFSKSAGFLRRSEKF